MKRYIFPKELTVGGVKYKLVKQYSLIDEKQGISEGPWYDSEPVDPKAYFMPDAGYTDAGAKYPTAMYRLEKP
jgi:hypothetical protein